MDLTNHQYAQLTVISHVGNIGKRSQWLCQCDCGNTTIVDATNLRRGSTKSCGCRRVTASFRHGYKHKPEYHSYQSAKDRCTNPNNMHYADYGGRGIEFRFKDFIEFLAAIGSKPISTKRISVDRIDNNGHYEKGNIYWATQQEQMRNTRVNRVIDALGESHLLCEWSDITGISSSLILTRISRGWCPDCSVSLKGPVCPHKSP